MENEPDSIVLRFLRRLDRKLDRLDGWQQETLAELRSIKTRMAAFMQSELAQDSAMTTGLTLLDKIERRLDINS